MRNHACSLNPLARGYLIPPEVNFPLRQRCAGVRTPHTGSVSSVLTAPVARPPQHLVVRPAQSSRRHPPIGVRDPKLPVTVAFGADTNTVTLGALR